MLKEYNTRSFVNFFLICWSAIFASGCSTYKTTMDSINSWTSPPITTDESGKKMLLAILNAASKKTISVTNGIIIKRVSGMPKTNSNEVSPYFTVYDEDIAKQINAIEDTNYNDVRTDILNEFRTRGDTYCHSYKTNLMQNQARSNFTLGTSALLLGSAGALATGANAAKVLAGGAALATGIRSEINTDYFYNQTVQILSKAIEKKQQIIWGLIQTKRKSKKSDYPIREALVDINNYNNVCSLNGALAALEKAVDNIDVRESVGIAASSAKEIGALPDITIPTGTDKNSGVAAPPTNAVEKDKKEDAEQKKNVN